MRDFSSFFGPERAGWALDRVRGSHHVFRHPDRPGIVVVPHPKKGLGGGLVAAIRKQARLQERR
ncbi:type II toxin-antitoxin system HicA family toxin [Nguyenibacter vanlangensis]|uniref:Type II toxin-antitoxin system HicA family toxin n=1 Tax=Nguyenibacter vanlangensis TaxID=1216886 RepID=A0ABZ3D864_9PROT